MTPREQYNQTLALEIIKQFRKRRFEGYYFPTAREAVHKALSLIEDGSLVTWGGSMSIEESGLLNALTKRNVRLLDRNTAKTQQERQDIQRKAFSADCYLMSSNAITMDGKLVNIDGNGNRVAALIYGPKKVIILAGMNKIVLDEEAAFKRIRNEASPINCMRLGKKTPCAETGSCHECYSDDTICAHFVVTRMCKEPGRIHVILTGEELGY